MINKSGTQPDAWSRWQQGGRRRSDPGNARRSAEVKRREKWQVLSKRGGDVGLWDVGGMSRWRGRANGHGEWGDDSRKGRDGEALWEGLVETEWGWKGREWEQKGMGGATGMESVGREGIGMEGKGIELDKWLGGSWWRGRGGGRGWLGRGKKRLASSH